MSKHSPKPWIVQNNTNESHGQLRVDAVYCGTVAICYVAGTKPGAPEEYLANANLIAAAPEMLKACKDTLDMIDDMDSEFQVELSDFRNHLVEIVAKAEGR